MTFPPVSSHNKCHLQGSYDLDTGECIMPLCKYNSFRWLHMDSLTFMVHFILGYKGSAGFCCFVWPLHRWPLWPLHRWPLWPLHRWPLWPLHRWPLWPLHRWPLCMTFTQVTFVYDLYTGDLRVWPLHRWPLWPLHRCPLHWWPLHRWPLWPLSGMKYLKKNSEKICKK